MAPARRRRRLALPLGAVAVAAAAPAIWLVLGARDIPAVIDGRPITIAAPVDGSVTRLDAHAGDVLAAGALLARIAADPPDESRRADLAARLDDARSQEAAARDRAGKLQSLLAGLPPDSAAQRTEIALRLTDAAAASDAATARVSALQRSLLQDQEPGGPLDLTSPAAALVRAMRVSQGQAVVRGLPVAELADCAHPRLLPKTAGLMPGESVIVRPDQADGTLPGMVRSESGQLVVAVDPAWLTRVTGNACPLGRNATIHPDPGGPRSGSGVNSETGE